VPVGRVSIVFRAERRVGGSLRLNFQTSSPSEIMRLLVGNEAGKLPTPRILANWGSALRAQKLPPQYNDRKQLKVGFSDETSPKLDYFCLSSPHEGDLRGAGKPVIA
jgi:hypothetical protein